MFEALGIAPGESEVYVAMVGNPRASADELATAAGLSRAQTGRALARLTQRGMVSRLPGRPVRFLAAPPDAAIGELIGAVESQLWQARDAVQRLMETHRAASRYIHPEQSLEVLVGQDNIGRRVAHLQNSANTQVRGFDKPPYLTAPGGNLENEGHRLRQGIRYRVIYTRQAVAWPGRLHADIASGLTDEGIARSLGWSTRTTQRRIRALMHDLDATTRFQMGMSAQARGWL
jgi:hypothetical protein